MLLQKLSIPNVIGLADLVAPMAGFCQDVCGTFNASHSSETTLQFHWLCLEALIIFAFCRAEYYLPSTINFSSDFIFPRKIAIHFLPNINLLILQISVAKRLLCKNCNCNSWGLKRLLYIATICVLSSWDCCGFPLSYLEFQKIHLYRYDPVLLAISTGVSSFPLVLNQMFLKLNLVGWRCDFLIWRLPKKTNKQTNVWSKSKGNIANNAETILEFKQVLKTLACGSHIMCINWFFYTIVIWSTALPPSLIHNCQIFLSKLKVIFILRKPHALYKNQTKACTKELYLNRLLLALN